MTREPHTEDNKDVEKDTDLLNAMIGRLSDEVYKHYKHHNKTKKLWDNLVQDFDSKNPLAESQLQRKLHTLTCTDPAKVDKHLDMLIEIKDKLETRNIIISDVSSHLPSHKFLIQLSVP